MQIDGDNSESLRQLPNKQSSKERTDIRFLSEVHSEPIHTA